MAEYVEYAGRKYWLQSTGRYFQSGVKTDNERLLHRRIWSDANGSIPPRHHIHHLNGDWRDNSLENLECVLGVDHSRDHMLERNATPEGLAASRAALEAGREDAAAWHASEAGLAWHREHGIKTAAARPAKQLVCQKCGQTFETTSIGGAIFCSRKCERNNAYRRHFDSARVCEACAEPFLANRYRPTIYCSRACSNRHRFGKAA